jgi:hypothetical protein
MHEDPWAGEPEEPVELIGPEDFLAPDPFPPDARRMGFDRWSDEGAIIALAASLNPAKPSHKLVAWVMLVAVLTPLVLNLWYELT